MTFEQKAQIGIVDFGSQTTHLIGRRLRQLGITSSFIDPAQAFHFIQETKPAGMILSGGPASVYDRDAPKVDRTIFDQNVPVLGICYGLQQMSHLLGGDVSPASAEFGPERLEIINQDILFSGIEDRDFPVIMSHGDSVRKLPDGFKQIAKTQSVDFAAASNPERGWYGVQFHPEASHTQNGLKILENFAHKICGLEINPLELNPQTLIEKIREQVGDKRVVCAVSGGVDSTVAAFLIAQAIGERFMPVYVDSGLMRDGTEEQVEFIFSQLIKSDLRVVNAQQRFLAALAGIRAPERKRKIIGKLYYNILAEEANQYPDVTFLGQGTIRSDVIESKGSKHASNIKSHHNVGGLPKKLDLTLLEPLREFYKDEVRELGRLVNLPEEVLMQQPFPGPGYAVRIRGGVTEKRLAQVKKADSIVMDEMKNAGLFDDAFQCFAIMTGTSSTAVKGDSRKFAEVVGIRAYQSEDVMTSEWMMLPEGVLRNISRRIVNSVPDVSRVVYDITSKPPATMEWE